MAKKLEDIYQRLQKPLAECIRQLPPILGNEVVNFAHSNFDTQSFEGKAWQKRKNPTKWGKPDDEGRALLIKTGRLRRSIRVSQIIQDRVIITAGGADTPYARAHNEGFKGTITQNIRPFIRRGKKLQSHPVRGFTRTFYQNIPKRQFIGRAKDSPQLTARLQKVVRNEFIKILKNI